MNIRGRIAQLGEHLPYKQGVIGSSPIAPTSVSALREYTEGLFAANFAKTGINLLPFQTRLCQCDVNLTKTGVN